MDLINYFGRNAEKFLHDDQPSPHGLLGWTKKLTTAYRPYPLVGVITPWNFPLAMAGLDVPPALVAGAAVLLKPSEVTPLSALELARGWAEIGAPEVFAIATGRGETGAAVVDAVDYVQFTGSTRTGQAVARQCVDQLKPYSLELGGKDPALVLADADINRAVHGIAWGGLMNAARSACRSSASTSRRRSTTSSSRSSPSASVNCVKARTARTSASISDRWRT
ncbi:hypothetical protein GCM10020255_086210 [Rhodococcus baikonurensis]